MLAETARERYDGGTFAVNVDRAVEDVPYTSHDLQESGGSAVWEAVADDFEPAVDLEDPDWTVHVEAMRRGSPVLPVHRPLLTTDKPDVQQRADAIGTFETASIPAGCNRLTPPRPETSGRLSKLREVEPDDLFAWAEEAASRAERVEL